MLCRVLTDDPPEVGLPAWLLGTTPARSAGRQPMATPKPSEVVDALQLKVETLSANIERTGKEAWDEGFRAGEASAHKSLDAQMTATLAELAAKISEVASQRTETIRRAEGDTVRLAIEIARRVLHREVAMDPSALSALVGAALEKLRNQEIYRVRIHPSMEKVLKSALEQFGRSDAIELLADPTLPRGGVSFEISRGSLDASVDTQLREIERGLVDEIKARS